MRLEISRLVRDTLYYGLVDHADTYSFPNVVGIRKNVFWYYHTSLEDRTMKTKSYSNSSKVDIIYALVQYITRHGIYKDNEIAILTPYAS
jgi:hypothetical protein